MEQETGIVIQHVLLLLVLIFGIGMVSGRIAVALRIPDVAMFLVAGIVVGQGLHWVNEPSTSFTNQFILTVGSVLILFDGGRNIRLSGLKKVWLTLTLLSVPGVLITAGLVGLTAHYALGIPMPYALLLGAIISSTDPATIIPVFRQVKIRKKIRETVESESAFNDATGSILTFSIIAYIMGTEHVSLGGAALNFAVSAIGGILVGCVLALIVSFLVAHFRLGYFRDYTTIAMIGTAITAYLIGDVLHVSGFMATFSAGLIWGNSSIFGLRMEDKQHEMAHFTDNITIIMRMLIFILLGSQVDFAHVYEYLWPSLGVMFVFMFIARPITVFVCALPDRRASWTWRELLFMCWVRETGVIPAALSGMVAGLGLAHTDAIASVTFLAILLTILLQASTTAYVGRKLGLEEMPKLGR